MKLAMHCRTCQHYDACNLVQVCAKGHKPLFYQPTDWKSSDWGHKRICSDWMKRDRKSGGTIRKQTA